MHWVIRNWRRQAVQGRRRPDSHRLILETLEQRCLLSGGFRQTDLVSDVPGMARTTDTNLLNSWGLASSPTGPFWIADNGAGVATVYNRDGQPIPSGSPLVVTIPPPQGGTPPSAPTGVVFNGANAFIVSQGTHSGPSQFLFATEDGTISGWNPNVNGTNAILAVDNSASGAVYKGLALGTNNSGTFLFATDFHDAKIDVFDASFHAAGLPGSFADPSIPAGFAPFGIRNIGGSLYVTYAKQKLPEKHDDDAGPGNGFVDVFDTNGNLLQRLASHGTLNSPWGLALAPATFGVFSNDLLAGNFGDGRISAFDPSTGAFRGLIVDDGGNPVTIDGLWALTFGNGSPGGDPNKLYFTAGPNGEKDGLFGSLQGVNQSFVAQVYRDLLQREADAGGLIAFSGLLDQGTATRAQVVQAIENSLEYHTLVVENLYQKLLSRAADPIGLNGWIGFLNQGGTAEQLEALFIGSAEYFARRGGGNNDAFLQAVYLDVLGRAIDPSGARTWGQLLRDQGSRSQVALLILGSPESDQDEVENLYNQLLHRAADPGGLKASVAALQQGVPNEVLVAVIVSSDEYFAHV